MNKILIKNGSQYHLGILINQGSEKSHVVYMGNRGCLTFSPKLDITTISNEGVYLIHSLETILEALEETKDREIADLKLRLQSTSRADYSQEIETSYNSIKRRIARNAERMLENIEIEDENFENRLKEICKLKKELFSITCDGAKDARKYNGTVKYDIKQVERKYNDQIQLLNMVEFDKLLEGGI